MNTMNDQKLTKDESQDIKRGLILVTLSSSWNYDVKKNLFWLRCANEISANRIIEKLPQLTQLSIRRPKNENQPILLWEHTQSSQYTQEMEGLKQENDNLFRCHQSIMSRCPDMTAKTELEAIDALRKTGLLNNQMNPNRAEFNEGMEKLRELGVHDNPYSRGLRSFPPNPSGITIVKISEQSNTSGLRK